MHTTIPSRSPLHLLLVAQILQVHLSHSGSFCDGQVLPEKTNSKQRRYHIQYPHYYWSHHLQLYSSQPLIQESPKTTKESLEFLALFVCLLGLLMETAAGYIQQDVRAIFKPSLFDFMLANSVYVLLLSTIFCNSILTKGWAQESTNIPSSSFLIARMHSSTN